MITLQDIKNAIDQAETDLSKKGLALEDIPVKHDYATDIENFDLHVCDYLGHLHAEIEIK